MELSLQHWFADLEDPRQAHKVKHNLQEIIVLAIIAVLSNAQSWTQIEAFGEAKAGWLKQWLALENGIDTIQRVFQALPAEELMRCFGKWTEGVMKATEGRFVAIDGKPYAPVMTESMDKKRSIWCGHGQQNRGFYWDMSA